MSSRDPTQPISGGRGVEPAPGIGGRWDEQGTPLHTLLILWRRRRGLILSVAALGTALATAAGLQVEPRFTATTAVMVAPGQGNVVGMDGVPARPSADAATVETEIKLINSRDHAARVVHTLSLEHDPELNPRNGHGDLAFTVADPWRIFVSWLPGDWLVATGLAEERTVQLTETRTPSLAGVLDHFAGRLQVKREGGSPVISISFTSSDPVKAATIANQVAELYVDGQLAARRSAATRASERLRDRLEVLRDELERSEQAVARHRAQHDLPDGISVSERELVALQRELILAQAELAERQARRELIAAAGTEGDSLKSIPEVMASPDFADLWRQESELQRIEGELGTIFGEAHPRMRSLAADKASLAADIETAIARIAGNIARETRVIEGRIGALKKQLDLVKGAGAESRAAVERLRELEREADASRQTYQTALQRFRETREQEQIVAADTPMIARAAPPLEPSSRGARFFVVFGFTGSSLIGVLLALLLERSRRGIRSARQLEAYLGLRCLVVCPRVPRALVRQGTPAHEDLLERALCAESMRALQLALRQTHHDRLPQVVQVTSAAPDEDKTTLAFSLAASLAQNGKRVLLFELDLRQPRLAERLQATADVSANRQPPLFSDVRHDPCTGVDLILVNRTPANPQAILTSAGLAGVVRRLRRRYDHVVVDSAPLLGLSDTKFVSSLVDATILVIRWQSMPLDVVRDAVGALRTVPAPLLGAVIAQVAIHR